MLLILLFVSALLALLTRSWAPLLSAGALVLVVLLALAALVGLVLSGSAVILQLEAWGLGAFGDDPRYRAKGDAR